MLLQYALIAFGFLLLLYVITQQGYRAVYAYVIAWMVYPHWGRYLFGIRTIPLSFFLEQAMMAVLWVKILRHSSDYTAPGIHREVGLQKLFWVTVIVQYTLGMWVVNAILPLSNADASITRLLGFGHTIAALTFFQACSKFIKSKEQIISFFRIYFYAAIVLAVELLATLFVPPVNSALSPYTIKSGVGGGFFSIFLNDYLSVQLVCATGVLTALYFWYSTRRVGYIFGGGVAALPIFFNTERSAILGLILGIVFFLAHRIEKKKIYLIMIGTGLVIALIAVNPKSMIKTRDSFLGKLAGYFSDESRRRQITNIFSDASIHARIGIQIRGIELALKVMPFGVGEDMCRYYMSLPVENLWKFGPSTHPETLSNYDRVSSGEKMTEVHNGYLDCLLSFGVLGLVALVAGLRNVWLNWKTTDRISKGKSLGLLRDAIFAMGLVLLSYHLFTTNPKIYVIIFVLLHASFLLSANRSTFDEQQSSGHALVR